MHFKTRGDQELTSEKYDKIFYHFLDVTSLSKCFNTSILSLHRRICQSSV